MSYATNATTAEVLADLDRWIDVERRTPTEGSVVVGISLRLLRERIAAQQQELNLAFALLLDVAKRIEDHGRIDDGGVDDDLLERISMFLARPDDAAASTASECPPSAGPGAGR